MTPHFLILTIAIIGAFVHGFVGFFVWGLGGLIFVLAIGWVLNWLSGGLLPRKVRNETATDFLADCPESVSKAYPGLTPHQRKQEIAKLLDEMYKRAVLNNPSMNLNKAGDPEVFFSSAVEVAEAQEPKELREMAADLVKFVRRHRLWYAHVRVLDS